MASKEENGTEPKKGSPLIKIVILVVILGVLGGGGYFAYLKFFHKAPAETASHEALPAEKVVCELDTFLVNLADSGGRRYLKIVMKLQLNNAGVLKEVETRNFELRDAILMILSGKEFEDISTSGGKLSLKQEITLELNRILKAGQVTEIYFTDFIVQ